MNKWFFEQTKIYSVVGVFWILPTITLLYNRYEFLETGVETPAFVFSIKWLKWGYGFTFQKGY